jgi:hypothetical protein
MNFNFSLLSLLAFCLPFSLIGKRAESTWRDLLASHANCVTWVSATVRLEISAGGRSLPPQEQKLEALGTIIAEDGLTVLSLSRVDPTASLLARMRTPGASVNVNYTEVLILMQDGTEVPAKLVLKDTDLDLAFVLPIKQKEDNEEFKDVVFSHVPRSQKEKSKLPQALDEVVSLGKLGRNLYRQSTLRKGWVNAVIEKPEPRSSIGRGDGWESSFTKWIEDDRRVSSPFRLMTLMKSPNRFALGINKFSIAKLLLPPLLWDDSVHAQSYPYS